MQKHTRLILRPTRSDPATQGTMGPFEGRMTSQILFDPPAALVRKKDRFRFRGELARNLPTRVPE